MATYQPLTTNNPDGKGAAGAGAGSSGRVQCLAHPHTHHTHQRVALFAPCRFACSATLQLAVLCQPSLIHCGCTTNLNLSALQPHLVFVTPQIDPTNPPPGTHIITCSNCKILLQYPHGAWSVNCPKCNTITSSKTMGMSCTRTHTGTMLSQLRLIEHTLPPYVPLPFMCPSQPW